MSMPRMPIPMVLLTMLLTGHLLTERGIAKDAAVALTPAESPLPIYDVVIYGGSPSGLAAAIQAARLGSRVIVVEPYLHIGGLMTGGLTQTDMGSAKHTGGIAKEFFDRIDRYYDQRNVERTNRFCFEPSVAAQIWREMLQDVASPGGRPIEVLEYTRLVEVEKLDKTLHSVTVRGANADPEDADAKRRIAGRVFIDATYEGDLAAEAGAPYRVGREAREEYGEPHGIDQADNRVQAYCFRLCVTDVPELQVPIEKPRDYAPEEFALLAEYVRKFDITQFRLDCLYAREEVRGKRDGNAQWHCWVSTDWAEINFEYPEADWHRREEIYQEYKRRTLGWFWFLQHDPSIPEVLRQDARRWGLVRDEFTDTDHLPFILYIREARRILGDYVFTEMDATTNTVKPDSIGCGGYPIDSHQVENFHRGNLHLRIPPGNFQIPVRKGYQIPYRIMLPLQVEGLLVSLCVSSTHLGYSTLRMEPEYIKIGQAGGVAAHLAHAGNVSPRNIDVARLQEILRKAGAILE